VTFDQACIFAILGCTMALFIWNRWRYDIVAGVALMAAVYTGLVPTEHAFDGFAHPAVITVASVLVISQGLRGSGAEPFKLLLLHSKHRFQERQNIISTLIDHIVVISTRVFDQCRHTWIYST